MFPSNPGRVAANTTYRANDEIERQTRENIWKAVNDGPGGIDRRLAELDREWDIERALQTNASMMMIAGTVLSLVDRRFLILPGLVGVFLLQHSLQGWCPPVPAMRRQGVRTQAEIDRERYALKMIRGDFANQGPVSGRDAQPVEQALRAVSL